MRSIIYTFMILASGLLSPSAAITKQAWKWIEPSDLYDLMKSGSDAMVVDIRSGEEFEKEKVVGSINMTADKLVKSKFAMGRVVVLVDGSLGERKGLAAANSLSSSGVSNVYLLHGGIKGWDLSGYPTIKSAESIDRGVSARELDEALKDKVHVTLYYLGYGDKPDSGALSASKNVKGDDVEGKMADLKRNITGQVSMSDRLNKQESIVLIMPEDTNNEYLVSRLALETKRDIRYLRGGAREYLKLSNEQRNEMTLGKCKECGASK